MLIFYGIWMLCHHGQSPKKGEKSKQRFLGYNEKTHFPFVKSARKPRNVSFLTQNPRFLRIVGYPAALTFLFGFIFSYNVSLFSLEKYFTVLYWEYNNTHNKYWVNPIFTSIVNTIQYPIQIARPCPWQI